MRFDDHISEAVRALADAVTAPLDPTRTAVHLDPQNVRLGILRHRVGPLLHAGVAQRRVVCDHEARAILDATAKANGRRAAIASLLQAALVARLADAGIACLVMKGLPLADQLYPAREMRHAGDLDLLVWPRDMRRAQDWLERSGVGATDNPMRGRGLRAAVCAWLMREVLLRDKATGMAVDLHQRLFFIEPIAWAEQDGGFAPRLAQNGDIPAPALGPCLVLYLLLHGAISGWSRLKWLVDLRLAVARLSDPEAAAVRLLAETGHVSASARAGLVLLQAVFAAPLPAPFGAWIADVKAEKSIRSRVEHYLGCLNKPDGDPFADRTTAMYRNLLFAERPGTRLKVLTGGPISSGLRQFARR